MPLRTRCSATRQRVIADRFGPATLTMRMRGLLRSSETECLPHGRTVAAHRYPAGSGQHPARRPRHRCVPRRSPRCGQSVMNGGQACVVQARILLPRSRYHEYVQALGEMVRALRVGDPFDETTDIGPLVSRSQQARVRDYIDTGIREGAHPAVGGTDMPTGCDGTSVGTDCAIACWWSAAPPRRSCVTPVAGCSTSAPWDGMWWCRFRIPVACAEGKSSARSSSNRAANPPRSSVR